MKKYLIIEAVFMAIAVIMGICAAVLLAVR